MSVKCYACNKPDSKYSCIKCDIAICNICSISAKENDKGYPEELYKVGFCTKCITPKNSDPPPAKKQKTIFSAFGMKQKPQVADINNPKILTDTTEKEPIIRKVTAATIEKWKSELVDFAVNEWLYYEKDASGVPTALFCKICTDHEEEIKSIVGFRNQYIKGSTNFRKSTVEYHAKNAKSHTVAYELHIKESGKDSKKLKNFKDSAAGFSDVLEGISTIEKNEVAQTKIKFETAYFVAKQELPLTKYKEILKHEKFHGVDTGILIWLT